MKPRSYMAIESGAMGVCGACAGEVARDGEGDLVCALPETTAGETPESERTPRPLCPLPAILAELRGLDPRRASVRENLLVVATDVWLEQHARSGTDKLPACVEPGRKKGEKVTENEGDSHAS